METTTKNTLWGLSFTAMTVYAFLATAVCLSKQDNTNEIAPKAPAPAMSPEEALIFAPAEKETIFPEEIAKLKGDMLESAAKLIDNNLSTITNAPEASSVEDEWKALTDKYKNNAEDGIATRAAGFGLETKILAEKIVNGFTPQTGSGDEQKDAVRVLLDSIEEQHKPSLSLR